MDIIKLETFCGSSKAVFLTTVDLDLQSVSQYSTDKMMYSKKSCTLKKMTRQKNINNPNNNMYSNNFTPIIIKLIMKQFDVYGIPFVIFLGKNLRENLLCCMMQGTVSIGIIRGRRKFLCTLLLRIKQRITCFTQNFVAIGHRFSASRYR